MLDEESLEERQKLIKEIDFEYLTQMPQNVIETLDPETGELQIHVDMTPLRLISFESVALLRQHLDSLFSSHNVKLISKRAERLYPNGYCVYVLYCNRCKKRRATY